MPAQYKPSEVEITIPKGEDSERISWSTEKVEQLMISMDDGYKPRGGTPFYDGNPTLRKGNILFDYTAHELEEIKRCASDICYFANHYCTVMTDEGLRTIELRDYQYEMLEHFKANRFSICLASRQIGKCLSPQTLLKIEKDSIVEMVTIGELYYRYLAQKRKLTFLERLKYSLYKILSKLS